MGEGKAIQQQIKNKLVVRELDVKWITQLFSVEQELRGLVCDLRAEGSPDEKKITATHNRIAKPKNNNK